MPHPIFTPTDISETTSMIKADACSEIQIWYEYGRCGRSQAIDLAMATRGMRESTIRNHRYYGLWAVLRQHINFDTRKNMPNSGTVCAVLTVVIECRITPCHVIPHHASKWLVVTIPLGSIASFSPYNVYDLSVASVSTRASQDAACAGYCIFQSDSSY